MKRKASVVARLCATIALSLTGSGCGSGDTGSTDAGSPDSTGQTGNSDGASDGAADVTTDLGQGTPDGGRDGTAESGQGGTADGGEAGTADGGEGGLPVCNPAPADMSPCNANPRCTETCGLDISALTTSRPLRTCTCSGSTASGGRWSCPAAAGACVYPMDIDLTCFQLPAPTACPRDTPDGGSADSGPADGGSSLIRSGTSACMLPSSEVCGGVCGSPTSTVFSYQDGAGAAKVGYCVCIAGIWQCTGVSEWPF